MCDIRTPKASCQVRRGKGNAGGRGGYPAGTLHRSQRPRYGGNRVRCTDRGTDGTGGTTVRAYIGRVEHLVEQSGAINAGGTVDVTRGYRGNGATQQGGGAERPGAHQLQPRRSLTTPCAEEEEDLKISRLADLVPRVPPVPEGGGGRSRPDQQLRRSAPSPCQATCSTPPAGGTRGMSALSRLSRHAAATEGRSQRVTVLDALNLVCVPRVVVYSVRLVRRVPEVETERET